MCKSEIGFSKICVKRPFKNLDANTGKLNWIFPDFYDLQ